MPFSDPEASRLIRQMREDRGLSPEALADEIVQMAQRKGEAWTRGTVDAFTVRRIEGQPGRPGLVPTIRVQFVLATYFKRDRREIWHPDRRVEVRREKEAVHQ